MSSNQVSFMATSPMLGITATGLPVSGTITNHGLVGLCQKGVWNPVRYRTSGSVVTRKAEIHLSCINFCILKTRFSNSSSGKPLARSRYVIPHPSLLILSVKEYVNLKLKLYSEEFYLRLSPLNAAALVGLLYEL